MRPPALTTAAVALLAFSGACGGSASDRPTAPAIDPATGTIVYVSDRDNPAPEDEELFEGIARWDVYRSRLPTGATKRLTDDDEIDLASSCSPDGRRVVVTRSRRNKLDLFLIAASGSAAKPLFTGDANRLNASWAPDGRRIVYARYLGALDDDDVDSDIYTADIERGTERPLVEDPARDASPSWSPRDEVAFLRATEKYGIKNDVYVVPAAGGRPERLFRQVERDALAWSADGNELAVVRNVDGSTRIWIVDRKTRRARKLTRGSIENPQSSPAWSRDGRWIVFVETVGLAVVHPDGTGYRQLSLPHEIAGTTDWPFYSSPSWCG